MDATCQACKGRGGTVENTVGPDGAEVGEWLEKCQACNGTGEDAFRKLAVVIIAEVRPAIENLNEIWLQLGRAMTKPSRRERRIQAWKRRRGKKWKA